MIRRPLKIGYCEEGDGDFIRWTANLLRSFLQDGSVALVARAAQPDILFASIWRKQNLPADIPVVLVSNENWKLFPPHEPLARYKAVLGLYPPEEPCSFIAYPYAAVHFDIPPGQLHAWRNDVLRATKTRFCCFVVSNAAGELGRKRIALFEEINRWQRVDAAGRLVNNLGKLAPPGAEFLRWIAQYKYMLCLENTKEPGYLTEKPFQAWFAGTVPIYDGGCVDDLNPDAIVNASSDDVVEKLKLLEADPAFYEAKRRAPLTAAPLSLRPFEDQFRARILETI